MLVDEPGRARPIITVAVIAAFTALVITTLVAFKDEIAAALGPLVSMLPLLYAALFLPFFKLVYALAPEIVREMLSAR